MSMTTLSACRTINDARGSSVIISTMSSMKGMDDVAPGAPLSLSSVPLMGGAAGLGLGIALSQPESTVIVLDGDASLLMELGVLATVAGAAPARFLHFVFVNGVQFNGNANLNVPGHGNVDFAAAALAAGYGRALKISDEKTLAEVLPELLMTPTPVLIELEIESSPPVLGKHFPFPEQPDQRFERMRREASQLKKIFEEQA